MWLQFLILIILGSIAYAVRDIYVRIIEYIKYRSAFDPDYPIFTAREIWVSKIKIDAQHKSFEEQDQKYQDYYNNHKEEIGKIKKNKDQSQELKNIMRSYHYSADELDYGVKRFRHMIDVNYEVKNSKKTYSEMCEGYLPFMFRKGFKKSYEKWLEYEDKN